MGAIEGGAAIQQSAGAEFLLRQLSTQGQIWMPLSIKDANQCIIRLYMHLSAQTFASDGGIDRGTSSSCSIADACR